MCELRPMPDNQEAFFSGLGEGASPAARQALNVAKNFDGTFRMRPKK